MALSLQKYLSLKEWEDPMKSYTLTSTSILLGAILMIAGVLTNLPPAEGRTGSPAPEISNEIWLNSEPLRLADLRGKVVMVEFWTFGCWNCRNIEPYVKAWHKKYAPQGLVVIAIHSPEFQYEHDVNRVKEYIRDNKLSYAVPIDNDFTTWRKFKNRYWPTLYLIDKRGNIQYIKIGEGAYERTEQEIQRLLAEKK